MHARPRLLAATLVLATGGALAAEKAATPANPADDVATHAIDAELRLSTDNRTRGISDSLNRPGVRLTAMAAHDSGLVGLAELASVSRKQFLGGRGIGLTLAGGYRFGDAERWHFGVGLATERFPGAKFDAPYAFDFVNGVPADFRRTRYDSSFAVLEAGYGALEARLLNVLSRTYRGAGTGGVCGTMLALMADPTPALACYARGDHGSRGTWLLDLDYKHPLSPATTLTLHLGHQQVKNFEEADFTDYRIGLLHKRWGFEWNADWVATNTKVRELYLAQDGHELKATDKARLVLSVGRRF